MKYEFLNYDGVQINVSEVLTQLDATLAQVTLPRDQHLLFHVAIQHVLRDYGKPPAKEQAPV